MLCYVILCYIRICHDVLYYVGSFSMLYIERTALHCTVQATAPGRTCVVGAGYVALECAGFINGLHQVWHHHTVILSYSCSIILP